MSAENAGLPPKGKFEIRTVHIPSDPPRHLGKGDFGTVERSHIVTKLLRQNEQGEWNVVREKRHPDGFATKTFHRTTAAEDARHSVNYYDMMKNAGVVHLPGTHRISDSDPRVVISTFLGRGTILITRNSVPEEGERPAEIDDESFRKMLAELTSDLERMSAHRITLTHDDAIFFELVMNKERAEQVDFVFGDFDTITAELHERQEEVFRRNVVQATRSLFWLMMSQRIIPGADPNVDNWAQVADRIQQWADIHDVDAQQVYDEYVVEIQALIAEQDKEARE
jgi:hypothetical protein